MNKNLIRTVLIGAAVGCMGIAMPSCPGQQETNQKIEALQIANGDLSRKIQKLESQVSSLEADMGQVKTLLPQVTNVLQAQKTTIDQLLADVKDLQKHKKSKKK
jgi:septal ring factor EnvC (AmiA/AmiB activator)